MSNESVKIFEELKNQVVKTFLEATSVSSKNVFEWGVHDIQQFQDHLTERTKSSVSEKWFYTYFKSEADKLPRIDMLNILSMYCGYNNWADFKDKFDNKEDNQYKKKANIVRLAMVLIGIFLITIVLMKMFSNENYTFQFCFVDNHTHNRITTPVEVIILNKKETPFYLKNINDGCFTWKTINNEIVAVVKSPYHHTDTIYRKVHQQGEENIKLKTDDYALMIHYYSTANVKEWKKRRTHLQGIIHDDAIIYQVHDNGIGIELYGKHDFINKLTLPTSSLKNIDIIETSYKEGKISSLKFKLTSINE